MELVQQRQHGVGVLDGPGHVDQHVRDLRQLAFERPVQPREEPVRTGLADQAHQRQRKVPAHLEVVVPLEQLRSADQAAHEGQQGVDTGEHGIGHGSPCECDGHHPHQHGI